MLLTKDKQILKLSDFGIRRRYNGKLKLQKWDSGFFRLTFYSSDDFYHYIAPEVLSGEGDVNNPAADVYSLAIVFWELLHRKYRTNANGNIKIFRRPYEETRTIPLCEKIIEGERPHIDPLISERTKEFMERWGKWRHNLYLLEGVGPTILDDGLHLMN